MFLRFFCIPLPELNKTKKDVKIIPGNDKIANIISAV